MERWREYFMDLLRTNDKSKISQNSETNNTQTEIDQENYIKKTEVIAALKKRIKKGSQHRSY